MQHRKRRRISALEIILRIGAMLMSLAMIIGLLPSVAFADGSDHTNFKSMIEPGTPNKYSDDMANPYGYGKGQKFLMAEQSELWLYYTLDWNAHKTQKYTKWFDNFQPFDGRSNTSLSKDNASFDDKGDFSGTTQAFNYVAAVGFDPNGTGRKDHVAYVGYENGLQSVEGTNKYRGYVLWVMDTKSGNQYGPWKVSIGSCSWLKDKRADLYAGSNFFNIVAGDFNGNGKDDLVISVVDDKQAFGLSQYRFENGSLRAIMTGNKDLLHPSANDSASKGDEAKDKLSMDFAVGDFNGDGIDDFAVVSYLNYGSSLNKTNRGMETGLPYLSVSYGASGSKSIASAKRDSLYICHDTNTSMYCSTITAGDINNDGKDELLAAGYSGRAVISNNKLTFGSDNNERLLYASFTSSDGRLSAIEYTELGMNKWTKKDNGREDPVGPKLMIEAVNIRGKAGGYVSLDYMRGHSVSKSHGEGTTFGGTVMGLDGKAMQEDGLDPNAWGFNWQLAAWNSNLKDNTENSKGYVPVIGYVLSGVQAPPMPVENQKARLTRTADSDELYFDLSWECGDVDGAGRTRTAGYRVYLYDIAEDTYKLVTTIDDPQTTAYRYQNTFDGREYYHFMITAFSEATTTAQSLQSVPRYATYYMSTADGAILKIEKTGTDGLVDTYTIYFVDNTTQTFTVTNGNGIKSVELLSTDPATGIDTYKITFTDDSYTTFTVKNGTAGEKGDRGEKGEDGKDGADGVGIDRIEKLRTEGNTDVYAVYLTDGTFYTFTVTNGVDGKDGKDGLDGKDGVDGTNGKNGKDGTNGTDGKDGKDGTNGKNGINGTDGKNGLNGKDGAAGKDGVDGKNVLDGKDGVGIKDCKVNDSGDLIVTLTDGSTINAGSVLASKAANAEVDNNSTNASAPLAIAAIGISSAALLWNIITLIIAILRKKNSDVSV